MNEVKIMIKAITDEAKKNLKGVREELEGIQKSAKETKAVDQALRAVGKGAVAAVAGVAALTTAMTLLGKSSMEFRKVQAQLVAGFQSVGLSAQQAGTTYKQLYGFLGDSGKAVEAANLLAQLTQDEEELAQWTNTLMGVYAKFPDSLPVEGLAEAANHTAHLGEVQGTLADALEWSGISVETFNAALSTTTTVSEREALIRDTLNSLYGGAAKAYSQANQSLIAYNQSQVALDQALVNATNYVVPLMTELNNLAATMLTVLKPAFETIAAVLIVFVQWTIAAIKAVGSFFGMFSEGSSSVEQVATNVSDAGKGISNLNTGAGALKSALDKSAKAAKELKRQTMGFDEMNIMSSQSSSSSSSGNAGALDSSAIEIPTVEIPEVDIDLGGLDDFQTKVDEVRRNMEGLLILVGAVSAGLLLWKLADFITDVNEARKILDMPLGTLFSKYGKEQGKIEIDAANEQMTALQNKAKMFGGIILIAAGAVLLIKGYCDAWINGLDWQNFALILGGIGLIVGGIALAFGPMAAAIALVVGGVVALVIGIKDLITNGYSMEAVIMVAVGAIAVLIGVIWALNAALLANPITWIVVAIMALVAVFVILWNECEGFRNFWIGLWEIIKTAFGAFIDSCQPLFDAMKNAFKEIWEVIQIIWGYIVDLFKLAWEAIKAVWDFVKPYFVMIWENIKAVFSVVVEVLGAYFKLAWEYIKAVWSVVVSYFRAIWDTIAGIFSVVKNVLKGNWQGAWDAIKGIVGTWAQYFKDIWAAIKKIFSAVGTFFKTAFGAAWDGIKKIFSNVGTFFTTMFDKIKSIFSKIGDTIGGAVSKAFKSAINWVLEKAIGLINGFIKTINGAIGIINKIPGVSISKIDELEVPELATGGITTGATFAMIGERGREAVLPLENNTGWMDMLADRIAERNSSPSKIVLKVGEKELGWATINSINDITKQTGGLQLQVI